MPELGEVRAQAARLHASVAGVPLERFEPLSFSVAKTLVPPTEVLAGPITRVTSRGKYLLIETGAVTFVVHLMQGGRLKETAWSPKKPRGAQARWKLGDGRALVLTEPGTERKAGVWVVEGDAHTAEPLASLGPDADTLDADGFADLARSNPARLHTMLRKQSVLAGLGRRLANEICHRAGLSPFTPTKGLDVEVAQRVVGALAEILAEDAVFEADQSEMRPVGERPSRVHGRTGEPCPTCGDEIREVAYRSYTVHYCPTCQTGGTLLADNTTSKFLK